MRKIFSALFALVLSATLANAQFVDQRTWGKTAGGSANALTISVPNYSLIAGVPLRFIVGTTNTGAATLNVSGTGAVAIKKSVGSGLINVGARDLPAGAVVTVVYDGTQFQLQSVLQSLRGCTPIEAFGGSGDGSTDNLAAWNSAVSSLTGNGACLAFGVGKYLFTGQAVANLPNSLFGFSIVGTGQDSTILYWSNAGNGIIVNYNNPANSTHVRDLSLTTGVANSGSGNAISLNQTTCLGSFALSNFNNVTMRGDDNNATFRWWNGAVVNKVSGTNWDTVLVYGSSSGVGAGITFMGNASGSCYSIQHNVAKSTFQSTSIGITYGDWAQGITISQTNVTNGAIGVQVAAGATGVLSQLNIFDSQFNASQDQIQVLSQISPMNIHNNMIFVPTGRSGVNIDPGSIVGVGASIVGNNFSSTGTTNNGIVFSASQLIATGNTFTSFASGIWVKSGATGVNIQSNYYAGNTCGVTNNVTCSFTNNSTNILGGGSF